MKGDPHIIKLLNDQLTNELTAINQYFLHARMYKHWGFEKLGKKEYAESIGEMKHADQLIDRILMLDGLPNLQALHKLMVGENTPEMLDCDLQLEKISQQTVKDGIAACEAAAKRPCIAFHPIKTAATMPNSRAASNAHKAAFALTSCVIGVAVGRDGLSKAIACSP